jgi:porin
MRSSNVFALLAGLSNAVLAAPCQSSDWLELENTLRTQGITPTLTYDGDVASNLDGGTKRAATYGENLYLNILVDGGRLAGWSGVTLFFNGLYIHGGQPSAFVGDAQGVSNIAAPPALELYEGWFQYNSAGSHISVLAGRYDLNSEFYRLMSASLFLNSSFGIGPEFSQSGRAGPSIFPDTSLALRITYKPSQNVVARGAIVDGSPLGPQSGAPSTASGGDGLLLVGELAFLTRPGPAIAPGQMRSLIGRISSLSPYEDKVAVGGWYYTASLKDLSEVTPSGARVLHDGSGGAYLLIDHLLYRDRSDGGKHISGFVQAGIGDPRVDRFGSYVGFGAVAAGFVPGRELDQFGFAVAFARNGAHYRDEQEALGISVSPSEFAIESTYVAQLTRWIAVQPDLQYVIHPNTDPRRANALVFQLELEVSI